MNTQELSTEIRLHFADERQMRRKVCKAINELCNENGGTIDFTDEEVDFDDRPYIAYDGGNHPEYASSLCNEVYSVTADGDSFYVDSELAERYGADRMYFIDITDIYDKILEFIELKNE